jgi:hypothetical protein
MRTSISRIANWYLVKRWDGWNKLHILDKDNSLYTLDGRRTLIDDYLIPYGQPGYEHPSICKACKEVYDARLDRQNQERA